MEVPVEQALATLAEAWPELGRLLLVWARLAPAVLIVPAFGLRAVIAPVRIALAVALALAAGSGAVPGAVGAPLTAVGLARELFAGLPVALTAAAALWAASMAGGLADTLRGERSSVMLPNLPEGTTPLGTLLGILVAIAFLESGGTIALVRAALAGEPSASALVGAAVALHGGIGLAIAVAMPLVVVSIVAEVAFALTARAANPAHLMAVLAPARSVVVLGAVALLLDRAVELLVLAAYSGTR